MTTTLHRLLRLRALVPLAVALFSFAAPALHAADELEVTPADKAFLTELKRALFAHDAAWVAAHVALPLHVRIDDQPRSIRTSAEFVENYDRIISVELVNIVRKQTAEYLFKNARGVMIGDGEIWYKAEPDDVDAATGKPTYRIIAISAVAPAKDPARAAPRSGG